MISFLFWLVVFSLLAEVVERWKWLVLAGGAAMFLWVLWIMAKMKV
jgi:hypothetical protein